MSRFFFTFIAEPTPSPAEIGQFVQMIFWLLGCVSAVLGVALLIKQLRRKHVPVAPTPQPLLIKEAKEIATKDDLRALEIELEERWNQKFKAQNDLVMGELGKATSEIHRLASAMQGLATSGHEERESIHNRINPLAEVTAEVRGKLDILLTHLIPNRQP